MATSEAQKRASKKYQASPKGKIAIAKCQMRYWKSLGYPAKVRECERRLTGLLNTIRQ